MSPRVIFLCCLLALVSSGAGNVYTHSLREICQRERVCNGVMCADICKTGTVQVDPWVTQALAFQRQLQIQTDQPLVKYLMPGTHNSAITQANGYGIEQDFIEALLGQNLYQGDDIGEGVCQHLSLTDQLNMGLRHLEIDINWDEFSHDILTCHSPVPLIDPVMLAQVLETAARRNITLDFDLDKLSCVKTSRTFNATLQEVKDWMDRNPQEVVILYLDTKFDPLPPAAEQGNRDILGVFGDMVYKVSQGSPLNRTVKSLIEAGTRVIFEDHEDGWLKPAHGEALVFVPDLWVHQFSAGSFVPYPNCSIEGDTTWYGNRFVRALDGTFPEAATRCGVNIVSGDYWQSDQMEFFVWSFARGVNISATGCVSTYSHGRWIIDNCKNSRRMACMGADDTQWVLSQQAAPWATAKTLCPQGYSPGIPTNGYANARLHSIALTEQIWLNWQNP